MPSEVFKTVVLSTTHITPEVADGLDELVKLRAEGAQMKLGADDWRYWIIAERWSDYGWFVWADIEDGIGELPASLYDCLCFARENGCRWIQFDCDGPIEDLTCYEW